MTTGDEEPERDSPRGKGRRDGERLGDLIPETLIPETTGDESAAGWGDDEDDGDPDHHLRREVPPHHD